MQSKAEHIELAIPEGVTAKFEDSQLTIKGPLGECRKDFSKVKTQVLHEGGKLIIQPLGKKKSDASVANTARSIIRNMIEGVTKGFTYKLKVVFAHFPVSVKVKDRDVLIENFYGERSPRLARIVGDCKVTVEGDDIVVRGVSLEDVGQTAANIEQVTAVKRKDQRVFLDGIYVYEKQRGY
ncbi:MAG: 50S ribosomal protein L6 [Nitrososphaerales archaeon]|nr:50S ribosomal protein L6 [Nitrososphaerales archaeon]